MFAWIMTQQGNLFAPFSGLPLVGLGSFAVQTSIGMAFANFGRIGQEGFCGYSKIRMFVSNPIDVQSGQACFEAADFAVSDAIRV